MGNLTIPRNSEVVSVNLYDSNGQRISVEETKLPIEIWINRDPNLAEIEVYEAINHSDPYKLQTFTVTTSDYSVPLFIDIRPTDMTKQFQVFMRLDYFPNITSGRWDRTYRIPSHTDYAGRSGFGRTRVQKPCESDRQLDNRPTPREVQALFIYTTAIYVSQIMVEFV